MKEPVDHIVRPRLPWRSDEGAITECGYDASKVKTMTREEFLQRYKDLGSTRMMMLTCMTCLDTARRWGTWADDPRKALEREINWENPRWETRGTRLRDELLAIEILIAAHRDEFDTLVRTTEQRRAWLAQKAAHAAKPRVKPGGGL